MADTAGLTHFQEACYHRMLMVARTQSDDWCSLPDDDEILARIVRTDRRKWIQVRGYLVPRYWSSRDGRLVNIRLEEEAAIQKERRAQQSLAGKKSAEIRHYNVNNRSTTVPTSVQRNGNGASASAVESKPTNGRRPAEPAGFAEWYSVYPRHEARLAAVRAYKAALTRTDAATLLAAAQRYRDSVAGRPPDKVKQPATWLNGGCWMDEPLSRVPSAEDW